MTERTIDVRGIPVLFEEVGEGRPVMVVHGFSLEHRVVMPNYEPVFEKRSGYRRIYLDMPGHGRTPAPDWLESEDQVFEVLTEFADAVAPGERLVLIGESWGAYHAHALASRQADRIDGLMMAVPVARATHSLRDVPESIAIVGDARVAEGLTPDEQEMFLLGATVQTPELLARFMELGRMLQPDEAFVERLAPNYALSFEAELTATIPAPALIIAGRQDAIVGYRDQWPLLDHLPRASFVVLDRAGHFLEDEQQGLLSVLTAEWLDRVEEFSVKS
jgi:pimeloyl-ACP methyl ester carboxylesterase